MDGVVFRLTLGAVDLVFWINELRQRQSPFSAPTRSMIVGLTITSGFIPRNKRQGWEDKLQQQFESMAREEFGIEIDDKVFLG